MQRLFCALYFPTTDAHGLLRIFPCQPVSIRVCFFPRTNTDSHGLFFSVSVRVHPWLIFSTNEHGLSRTFFRVSPCPSVFVFFPRTNTDSHGLSFVSVRVHPWLLFSTNEHGLSRTFFRVSPCPSVFVFPTDEHGLSRTFFRVSLCPSVFVFFHERTRTLTDYFFPCQSVFIRGYYFPRTNTYSHGFYFRVSPCKSVVKKNPGATKR